MTEVLQNPYFQLFLDVPARLVRLVRTAVPFPDIEAVRQQYTLVAETMDRLGRKHRHLFIDLRQAPGRNDPEFEAVMEQRRPAMFAGYERVAICLLTKIGMLQVRRHVRMDGFDVLVSDDESAILAYLATGQMLP